MITIKQILDTIKSDVDDSGQEWLCIFYTGAIDEMQAVDDEGNKSPALGFDIVGPNVDQLSIANLLDKYSAPNYTIKAIKGRPNDDKLFLNEGIESFENDLKRRTKGDES